MTASKKKYKQRLQFNGVVSMMVEGIKIHETKRHALISFLIAAICLIIGVIYIRTTETIARGIIAVVLGALLAIAAVYRFFTPMFVLGDNAIYFQSGKIAKKEILYSEIASWTLQGDKYLTLKLKSDKEEKGAKKTSS
ncbi:MAG: hypothetical protein ACLPP9_06565 [Smithella sp.]